MFALSDEDRAFVTQMYADFGDYMYAVAKAYLKDQDEKEDVISECMCSLMRRVETLRGLSREALKKYIAITVQNTAIQHIRRAGVREKHSTYYNEEMLALVTSLLDPVQSALFDEGLRSTYRALRKLSPKERAALLWVVYFQLGYEEAAVRMNMSVDAVRHAVSRARRKLKANLFGEGEEK